MYSDVHFTLYRKMKRISICIAPNIDLVEASFLNSVDTYPHPATQQVFNHSFVYISFCFNYDHHHELSNTQYSLLVKATFANNIYCIYILYIIIKSSSYIYVNKFNIIYYFIIKQNSIIIILDMKSSRFGRLCM